MIRKNPLTHAEHLALAKEFHVLKRKLRALRGRYMKTHRVIMRLRPFEEALDNLRSALEDEYCQLMERSEIKRDFYPYYHEEQLNAEMAQRN